MESIILSIITLGAAFNSQFGSHKAPLTTRGKNKNVMAIIILLRLLNYFSRWTWLYIRRVVSECGDRLKTVEHQ